MVTITRHEVNLLAADHAKWLAREGSGWKERRADFSVEFSNSVLTDVDLSGTDFRRAKFNGVRFVRCNMRDAVFDGASMLRAEMEDCVLDGAKFAKAGLVSSVISGCSAVGADFSHAVMPCSSVLSTKFRSSVFHKANACSAVMQWNDFSRSDMSGACMSYSLLDTCTFDMSDMSGFKAWHSTVDDCEFDAVRGLRLPVVCPEGYVTDAWKRCGDYIVHLRIPEDARVISVFGPQCRCDKAEVVDIELPQGGSAGVKAVSSGYRDDFVYRVGEAVSVDDFDENRWSDCTSGIHFYMSRMTAVVHGRR